MPNLSRVDVETKPFSSGPITDEEAGAMIRAAINLFKLWGLTDQHSSTLVGVSLRTFARWKTGDIGNVTRDVKARLSNIMGIHKGVRIIFKEAARGYAWMGAPNEAFGGLSALQVMLQGDLTDLMRVRRYVDSERGGW